MAPRCRRRRPSRALILNGGVNFIAIARDKHLWGSLGGEGRGRERWRVARQTMCFFFWTHLGFGGAVVAMITFFLAELRGNLVNSFVERGSRIRSVCAVVSGHKLGRCNRGVSRFSSRISLFFVR